MQVAISHLIAGSLLLLVPNLVEEVVGHGMLLDPVNRGSMWRKGYSTPINYDDSGVFCGGYARQWGVNNGECGPCGDDYSLEQPRPNENTGVYGTGIVVDTYAKGMSINLTVLITANHKGYFKFNICPLEDQDETETEDCFEKYPLLLDNGSETYDIPSDDVGIYQMTVQLPDTLTCERCVLRWHWTTGNNWGICTGDELAPAFGDLGCGPQETFRTCSDISIVGNTPA